MHFMLSNLDIFINNQQAICWHELKTNYYIYISLFTMYQKLLLFPLLAISMYSCKNKQLVSGHLKNLTGLESCSWIIELDKAGKNGITKLEPNNLNAFKITLKEGQAVQLKYKELQLM